MKHRKISICLSILGIMIFSSLLSAVRTTADGKILKPERIDGTIVIDGLLDEPVWRTPPLSAEFITCSPVYGQSFPQKTEIRMVYNDRGLYFAFRCYDTEPDKIKTSICKRDNNSRDDWVGVILDALGNKQTCYEFYVNPSGIQADCLNSAVSGYDMAPDFVWESAGRLTAEGYQVEICIPLESIRFKSGREIKMGILFMRSVSRLGTIGSWPELEPGQTMFNFMTTAVYRDLRNQLKLEVLPNITYSRNSNRETAQDWGNEDSWNVGASLKYGITSSITAEATINPDFSQVESDAFQVEVNQRYPIFYSEKRPFFMEGMDVFDFGLVNQGMLLSAVHTRNIVDPGWAGKFTGTTGKISFALLAADDKAPGRPWESGVNPDEGKNAFWSIARLKYNLGSDNSFGILYSGRFFAGETNNVAGLDLQYRFFKNIRINLSYLHAITAESRDDRTKNGGGLNAMIQYSIPRLDVWAAFERYDGEFVMESAFLRRSNLSKGQFYFGPNFFIKSKGLGWLQKIQPYFNYAKLHDMGTQLDDTTSLWGVDFFMTRQGFLRFQYRDETEGWQGRLFESQYFYAYGYMQFFKWLYMYGLFQVGDQLYYDPDDPFVGNGSQLGWGIILQPDLKMNLKFDYRRNRLREKESDSVLYTVDIYNVHATYQFNKYFYIRGLLRYNNYQKKLLTDFLASFTLIPGTVVHVGYGSLYENKEWLQDKWMPGTGDLLNTRNSLFFKVSYLWRLR